MQKARRIPVSEKERQCIHQYAQKNPQLKQRELAAWASKQFGRTIGQSTISETLSKRWQYLDDRVLEQQIEGSKEVVHGRFPSLERALLDWILRFDRTGIPIDKNAVRHVASNLWQMMPEFHSIPEPKWSDGWLREFTDRWDTIRNRRHAASASVNHEGPIERLGELQDIIKQYAPEDVFSVGETGLSWTYTPEWTYGTQQRNGRVSDTLHLFLHAMQPPRRSWISGQLGIPEILDALEVNNENSVAFP